MHNVFYTMYTCKTACMHIHMYIHVYVVHTQVYMPVYHSAMFFFSCQGQLQVYTCIKDGHHPHIIACIVMSDFICFVHR